VGKRVAERPAAPARVDGRKLAAAIWQRLVGLLSGAQAKLTGLFARSGRKEAKPAIPRFAKPAVQGELSLDRIKVMRNDLSDADLEVVAARPPVVPAATAPTPRAAEEDAGTKSAWGRATTRFLGAGKT